MAKKLGKLATRYARALRSAVIEELGDNGSPTPAEKCADSLEQFAALWQDKELNQALLNPMFSREDRRKVVVDLAKKLAAPEVVARFLQVLVDRDRLVGIVEIAAAFRATINEAKGVVTVVIETARDVDQSERQETEATLRAKIKGELRYSWQVDPSLIGGMVVKYQGNVLDGSIKGRLTRLEEQLRGAHAN